MISRITKSLAFGLVTGVPAYSQDPLLDPPLPDNIEEIRPKPGPKLVNKIAATVNGDLITLNELMIKVAPIQSGLMAQNPRRGVSYQRKLAEIKSKILDELIDRTIIFTEFKDRVNTFPDHQIEAEVKRIIQNVYQGDEELFKKYLQANHLTRDQFKEQQRKELLVQIVKQQHFGDVAVPKEKELREEYERWKITNRDRTKDVGTYQRIYIDKFRGAGPLSQLKLTEDLIAQLRAGSDFAELAKKNSNGSEAQNGGLIEDEPRTDRSMEFGAFIFDTEGNQVMGPFEDPRGFNIVQVLERKLGPAKPFAEVREEMKRRVISTKKGANFEKWMKKMRTRAVIDKKLDFRLKR